MKGPGSDLYLGSDSTFLLRAERMKDIYGLTFRPVVREYQRQTKLRLPKHRCVR